TFTHANGVEPQGAFTATVQWGSVSTVSGTVTRNNDGSYTVSAPRPVFTEDGTYPVTVSISEDNVSATVNNPHTVNEPAISGSTVSLTTIDEGDASASVTVATFTHAHGVEPQGAFTATVDWG